MKKFRFSLQTVHNLRESRRDEAERGLAHAASAVTAAVAALEAIQKLRGELEEQISKSTGPLCIADLSLRMNYLDALSRREAEAKTHLARLEQERDRHREDALAAARDAEVTEQLRARRHARHVEEHARLEQDQLDEMAIACVRREARKVHE